MVVEGGCGGMGVAEGVEIVGESVLKSVNGWMLVLLLSLSVV